MAVIVEIGSLAGWVSGIGSFSAASVALYLAHRGQPIKLIASCGLRSVIREGFPEAKVLAFFVTNVGTRATKITNIGIRTGTRKKKWRFAIIDMATPDPTYLWIHSSKIPNALQDGDTGNWNIPLGDDNGWLQELVTNGFLTTWSDVDSFRVLIFNAHGRDLIIQPELGVRTLLHDLVDARIAASKAADA